MAHVNRVFVVDADCSARSGLARLLRAAGHDVRDFASAEEFLAALDAEASGCVVLDASVPGLSGEKLMSELAARSAHLQIIVVTTADDPEIRRMAGEMRAAAYFRKPVDGPALLDAIAWALRLGNRKGR